MEKVGFGLQGDTGPFFKNLSYHSIKSEKQKNATTNTELVKLQLDRNIKLQVAA